MENHFEVVQCLNNLSKQDLMKLGGALGLSYPKLRNMEPLLEEIVCAWLNKEDNVLQIGKPSWEGLKLALHKIGQEGVVNTITQGITCCRYAIIVASEKLATLLPQKVLITD